MFNGLRRELNNDPFTDINVSQTAINELQNKPRYDIDKRRYGNTLSDDMFSIKNANRPNQHTPESYEYFGQTAPSVEQTLEPAAGWDGINQQIPSLKGEHGLVGRKVNVTGDSVPWGVYKDWGLTDDILEFPENYSQEQVNWAEGLRNRREAEQTAAELSTDSLRNEKFGRVSDDMSLRRDSLDDSYLDGALVNYDRLSPATLEQLAKMGVNRPVQNTDINQVTSNEDANDYLMSLINAYKYAMEHGYR